MIRSLEITKSLLANQEVRILLSERTGYLFKTWRVSNKSNEKWPDGLHLFTTDKSIKVDKPDLSKFKLRPGETMELTVRMQLP